MRSESRLEQTVDGKPIGVWWASSDGGSSSSFVKDGKVLLSTEYGVRQLDLPEGEWLTTIDARRELIKRLPNAPSSFRLRVISDTFLGDMRWDVTIEAPSGETDPRRVVVAIQGLMRGREIIDFGPDGAPQRSVWDSDRRREVLIAADRSIERQPLPPFFSVIGVKVRLSRNAPAVAPKQVIYRLTVNPAETLGSEGRETPAMPAILSAGCQRTMWANDSTANLLVAPDVAVAPRADLPAKRHTMASTRITSNSKAVAELVARALKGQPETVSAERKAEVLRRFVYTHIADKELVCGFSSVDEAIAKRCGDSTEHAMLLASMLRHENIPTRLVTGLAWSGRRFMRGSYFKAHWWVQAWLPGEPGTPNARARRWVDLDATLENERFNATRIALATDMFEGESVVEDMRKLASWVHGMKIEVVSPKEEPEAEEEEGGEEESSPAETQRRGGDEKK